MEGHEVFLQDGFGFVARSKVEGNFAAVTFSSAVSPEEVDIGVETDQAFIVSGIDTNYREDNL